MSKRIIKHLLWSILITLTLILMPTNKSEAVTISYTGYSDGIEGFKTNRSLFCINRGDYFGSSEQFNDPYDIQYNSYTGEIYNANTLTGKSVFVVEYIASSNYEKYNISDYIPQQAIWGLTGTGGNTLLNKGYAYDEFKRMR